MFEPDETPLSALLAPFDASAAAALQHVQDSGETLVLAEVDEAEMVAAGLGDAARRGRAQISDAEVATAADRLVARGLAMPQPWSAGRVRPAGGLLLYAQLVLDPRAHIGLAQSWSVPEPAGAARDRARITVLIDVVRGGLCCMERSSVPASDPPTSVPVTLQVMRLDVLVKSLVRTAFGSGGATESVVAFADGRGELVPSRLRVDVAGHGQLETSRHRRLGSRTVRQSVDAAGYADHLKEQLMRNR